MSFKFGLNCEVGEISIDTEVRLEKVKGIDFNKLVVMKTADGKVVKSGTFANGEKLDGYNRGYVAEDGTQIDKSDIHYFTKNKEGVEVEISPYERTKTIQILKTAEAQNKEQFVFEGVYEMFGTNTKALYKMAKWLSDNNQVALAKFTFGNGFKEFVGCVYPVFKEDGFVLVFGLSRAKIEYKNLMTLAKAEAKMLPTLSEVCL